MNALHSLYVLIWMIFMLGCDAYALHILHKMMKVISYLQTQDWQIAPAKDYQVAD